MYKKLTINMMVKDMNATLDFYSVTLDSEFKMAVLDQSQEIVTTRGKDQSYVFAIVQLGKFDLMFQAKKNMLEELPVLHDREMGASATFYIEVEDIKTLYAKIKDQVTIVKDLHQTFYGMQEFYIQDCNGYILTFAQPIGG